MTALALLALVLSMWLAVRGGAPAWCGGVVAALRPGPACRWVAAALLPVAFAAANRLAAYQATHDGVRGAIFAGLPFPVVDDALPFGPAHAAISFAALGCVLAQTLALAVLCAAACERRRDLAAPIAAGVALAALALGAPALTSTDAYGYAVDASRGFDVYDFSHAVNAALSPAMRAFAQGGSVYGPLWTTLSAALARVVPDVGARVEGFRVLGALWMVAGTALLAGFVPRRAVLAFALNPMLWHYDVADAHNDLLAAVLVVGALRAVRARPAIAALLVAAAGCVKLPFVLLGTIAFAGLPRRRALVAVALATLGCGAAYACVAGAPFAHAFASYVGQRRAGHAAADGLRSLEFGAAAALAYALAFARRRGPAAGAWLVPAGVPTMFAWYLVWTLPCAIAVRRRLTTTLVLLPPAAASLDFVYDFGALPYAVLAAVALACAADALAVARRERRTAAGARVPGEARYG